MAKIYDIAQHAGLTPREVLDVVNGNPINEGARRAVAAAIAELGQPDRPVGAARHVEVLPETPPAAPAEAPALPASNGDALLAAVRAELEPQSARIAALTDAFAEIVRELQAERRAHVDDFELLADLAIDGWRGVDRRLGRLEQMIGRMNQSDDDLTLRRERTVKRLEDWIQDRD